jgi:DNA-binding NtrC family response regulator
MAEPASQVLIVDDDKDIREILAHLLTKEGFKPILAEDAARGLQLIRREPPDVLLVDVMLPGLNGMEVLKQAREMDPDLPVIMITAYAGINNAVEAMRAGAHDYLPKPFQNHEVVRVVRRALVERHLKRTIKHLSEHIQDSNSLRETMGPSDAIGRLIGEVERVAESDFTVIILGETGSGKELVARAIHNSSQRARGPFVPVDCGAIPETLLESELFGHEKGAFTGAEFRKAGKFELAKGGTLLLDEIANMPLGSQSKLLRALQEKVIYRVGGTRPLKIDIRLLVASNQNLEATVASGSFRRDLFYRLNEFTIKIPPLRERKEDITYLAKRFLDKTNQELHKNIRGVSESALEALLVHSWPGNVRQLRSAIRQAVLMADSLITEKHLRLGEKSGSATFREDKGEKLAWKDLSLREIVQRSTIAVEREVIYRALCQTGGNKAKAARLLQIDYKTMHSKVKQYAITIN